MKEAFRLLNKSIIRVETPDINLDQDDEQEMEYQEDQDGVNGKTSVENFSKEKRTSSSYKLTLFVCMLLFSFPPIFPLTKPRNLSSLTLLLQPSCGLHLADWSVQHCSVAQMIKQLKGVTELNLVMCPNRWSRSSSWGQWSCEWDRWPFWGCEQGRSTKSFS